MDGVVVLDKPAGITSFRSVEKVGRILGVRKRGHAGTLDPIATGVLPICLGRATKIAGYIAARDKEYDVTFAFGAETDTGDLAGRVVESAPGARAEEEAVARAVAALVGTWEQTPPAFSAVKVGGRRAYALARRGEAVELAPRPVTVTEARLLSWSPEGFRAVLTCSKGFYVRSLARDLGRSLGAPMAVSGLRRLRSGPFRIEEAVTFERLAEAAAAGRSGEVVRTIGEALEGVPQWEVPPEAAAAVRQGRTPGAWLGGRGAGDGGDLVLLTSKDEGAVALVARDRAGIWRIVRGI